MLVPQKQFALPEHAGAELQPPGVEHPKFWQAWEPQQSQLIDWPKS
jgi:hypothetical protein